VPAAPGTPQSPSPVRPEGKDAAPVAK